MLFIFGTPSTLVSVLQRTQNYPLHRLLQPMKVTCIVTDMQVLNCPAITPLDRSTRITGELRHNRHGRQYHNRAAVRPDNAWRTAPEFILQRTLIMIGVSGSGKSEIGQRLAARLHCRFVEGDALHAPASIAKMTAGIALDDADREGWLLRLQEVIGAARAAGTPIVVACSALKHRYRQILRGGDAALVCIHLQASRDVLQARMATRSHFMPAALLDSQLRDLEPLADAERGFRIDVDQTAAPEDVVARVAAVLNANY